MMNNTANSPNDENILRREGVILDGAKVKFGNNVFIAPNCAFYTARHPLDVAKRNMGLEYAKPVIVGDNVWIGGNVVVVERIENGTLWIRYKTKY